MKSVSQDDSIRIAFGPVPSRRLGRSLGVNNIPPKVCTYSCVYCQVGCTLRFQIEPSRFYEPEEIVQSVREKVGGSEGTVDYLTLVPDGEPTLDARVGTTIGLLKSLGIKIAVITNATLIDREENLNEIASFLSRLRPQTSYISIPTRPPAESWVLPPGEQIVAGAHQILAREVGQVELLIGYEGNAFASTGNPAEDLLSITAVHPMQEQAVAQLLQRTGSDWSVVGRLCDRAQLVRAEYGGKKFYLRAFSRKKAPG